MNKEKEIKRIAFSKDFERKLKKLNESLKGKLKPNEMTESLIEFREAIRSGRIISK